MSRQSGNESDVESGIVNSGPISDEAGKSHPEMEPAASPSVQQKTYRVVLRDKGNTKTFTSEGVKSLMDNRNDIILSLATGPQETRSFENLVSSGLGLSEDPQGETSIDAPANWNYLQIDNNFIVFINRDARQWPKGLPVAQVYLANSPVPTYPEIQVISKAETKTPVDGLNYTLDRLHYVVAVPLAAELLASAQANPKELIAVWQATGQITSNEEGKSSKVTNYLWISEEPLKLEGRPVTTATPQAVRNAVDALNMKIADIDQEINKLPKGAHLNDTDISSFVTKYRQLLQVTQDPLIDAGSGSPTSDQYYSHWATLLVKTSFVKKDPDDAALGAALEWLLGEEIANKLKNQEAPLSTVDAITKKEHFNRLIESLRIFSQDKTSSEETKKAAVQASSALGKDLDVLKADLKRKITEIAAKIESNKTSNQEKNDKLTQYKKARDELANVSSVYVDGSRFFMAMEGANNKSMELQAVSTRSKESAQ
jgi:hypothetical protein